MNARHALPLALALSLFLSGAALADRPGKDWMPMEQVIGKLKAAGYSSIHQLEADDGRWEGEGTKNGRTMEFEADPRTGEIISEREDD